MSEEPTNGPAFLGLGQASTSTMLDEIEAEPLRLFKPATSGRDSLEIDISGIIAFTEEEIEELGPHSQKLAHAVRGWTCFGAPLRVTLIGPTASGTVPRPTDEALAEEFLRMMAAPTVPDPELS